MLPEEELDRIYRVCAPPWRTIWARDGWQATVSCNGSRQVWPTTQLGPTPLDKREYLPMEDFPHLAQIVAEVLRLKPRRRGRPAGGRIFVKDDRFFFSPGEGKEEITVGIVRRITVAPRTR